MDDAEAVAEELEQIEESLTRLPVVYAVPAANDPWADIDITEPGEIVPRRAPDVSPQSHCGPSPSGSSQSPGPSIMPISAASCTAT